MTARTTAIELEFEFDRAVVGSGDLVVDPRAAHGVAQPVIDKKITDEGQIKYAYKECCQMLEGLWYLLDCLWVNQPEKISVLAEN